MSSQRRDLPRRSVVARLNLIESERHSTQSRVSVSVSVSVSRTRGTLGERQVQAPLVLGGPAHKVAIRDGGRQRVLGVERVGEQRSGRSERCHREIEAVRDAQWARRCRGGVRVLDRDRVGCLLLAQRNLAQQRPAQIAPLGRVGGACLEGRLWLCEVESRSMEMMLSLAQCVILVIRVRIGPLDDK